MRSGSVVAGESPRNVLPHVTVTEGLEGRRTDEKEGEGEEGWER
ncbi:hypothetical protein E2C01_041463 [Portunus trituberculatus]|uniref:Uncharacterized protein n=1 Tax=Portunus trituberculatus TaxID=210409 RepID=A0A5B7FR07_PORTR|nr:hypothetical protein [Portunus trituberculatus]